MYKVKHGNAPDIMKYIFRKRKTAGNTRNPFSFETSNIKTVYYGSETVTYLVPKIRKLAPQMTKDPENINFFESNTKFWKLENYPSRMCKSYSQLVSVKCHSFIAFLFVLIDFIIYTHMFFLYETFVLMYTIIYV